MKQFISKHKYIFLIFVVFLIITGVSGYQAWKASNNKSQITNKNTTTPSTLENINSDAITTTHDSKLATNDLQPTIENLPLKTYVLEANSYNLTPSSTVYNLMQWASADSRSPFLFETKDFGSMGLFVESINNLKNNPQTGEYWIYYLNNESAQLGISQQIIKPNDIITWKYEISNF